MAIDFSRGTAICKALADESRVRIVHILSCGELCACDIHDYFDLSQPTLSHHLNILVDSGIVVSRHEGKWTHYSLARDELAFFENFIKEVSHDSDKCLCKKMKRSCE
ncbi:MAG TPA: metalloregulator ArsR/SmtB family transcription factor [Treponemataceae bacterium]|nr:metalloregulator ArsR/SmtB family transcription factor [Treponemataceae bacterium]